MAAKARVGILGSGDAGQAFGRGFPTHGYEVMLGSRTPRSEAAAHGDVVLLALHGAATDSVLDQVGPKPFAGKLVIDVTNPLVFPKGGLPGLFVGTTDSLGERVQRKLPGAKVVKAFNTVPNSRFIDPKFKNWTGRMFLAGDHADAKQRTEEILKDLGWAGAVDAGGIDSARWLEVLVPLWARAAMASGSWDVVLGVVS